MSDSANTSATCGFGTDVYFVLLDNEPAFGMVAALKASVVVANAASLLVLGFLTYFTYQRVDISHPVFAILFQELAFLTIFGAVLYITLLASVANNFGLWVQFFLGFIGLVAQMHQVTWLFVTCLR